MTKIAARSFLHTQIESLVVPESCIVDGKQIAEKGKEIKIIRA